MHRLINAGLIGAKRPAALKHERDPVATLGAPTLGRRSGRRWMIGQAGTDIMHGGTLELAKMRADVQLCQSE
jgi:hypothetical protein